MLCPILPKHKDDGAAVDRLRRVVEETGHHENLRAILLGMLEWTVDPQWPVAEAMGGLHTCFTYTRWGIHRVANAGEHHAD